VVLECEKMVEYGLLQFGAPFGSCKNVAVPNVSPVTNTVGNTSPLTNTAGSFSGSVQFSKSASTIQSPNSLVFYLFFFISNIFLSYDGYSE
jgi:hypothetical protein